LFVTVPESCTACASAPVKSRVAEKMAAKNRVDFIVVFDPNFLIPDSCLRLLLQVVDFG